MTNADKIRMLSDEDLFVFLSRVKKRAVLASKIGGDAFDELMSEAWLADSVEG